MTKRDRAFFSGGYFQGVNDKNPPKVKQLPDPDVVILTSMLKELREAIEPFIPKCVQCGKKAKMMMDDGDYEVYVCSAKCGSEHLGASDGVDVCEEDDLDEDKGATKVLEVVEIIDARLNS